MTKEKVKNHIEESLRIINKIGDFCVSKEENDSQRALFYVSSNFHSTAQLLTSLKPLLENSDSLTISAQHKSTEIDPYKQTSGLIDDQSRFTFIATMSSLEFTAKIISLKDGLPVEEYLMNEPNTNNNKRFYLKDIINASKKLKLITADEKKEWDFFLEVRNSLVHNNAIIDKNRKGKGNLELKVYGKLYSYREGERMKGNIQSLFIFSKRVVELFYDWSQKHEKIVMS